MSCDRFACGEPALVGAYVGGKLVARVCSEACGLALIGPKRDAADAELPASRASDSAAMRTLEAATSALTLEARRADTLHWEQMARAARMLAIVALARANEFELMASRQLHHALTRIESRIDDPGVARQELDAIIGDLDAALTRIAAGGAVDLDVHRDRVLALRQAATDLVRLGEFDDVPPGAAPDDQRLAAAHRQFPATVVSTFKLENYFLPTAMLHSLQGIDGRLAVQYDYDNHWLDAETRGPMFIIPHLGGDVDFLGNSWIFTNDFGVAQMHLIGGVGATFQTNLNIDQRQTRVQVGILGSIAVVATTNQAVQTNIAVANADISPRPDRLVFSDVATLPGVVEQVVVAHDQAIWLKMRKGYTYELIILDMAGTMIGRRAIASSIALRATSRGVWCVSVVDFLPAPPGIDLPAVPRYLEGFLYRLDAGRTDFAVDRFPHAPDDIRTKAQLDEMKARQSADKARFTTVAQLATLLGKMAALRARALSMTPLEVSTATLAIGTERNDRDLDRLEAAIKETRLAISNLIRNQPYAMSILPTMMQRMRATIAIRSLAAKSSIPSHLLSEDVRRLMVLRANPLLHVGSFPTEIHTGMETNPRINVLQGNLFVFTTRIIKFSLDGRIGTPTDEDLASLHYMQTSLTDVQKLDYLGYQWEKTSRVALKRTAPDGTVVVYTQSYPLGDSWLGAGDYILIREPVHTYLWAMVSIKSSRTIITSEDLWIMTKTIVLAEGYLCRPDGAMAVLTNGPNSQIKVNTGSPIAALCGYPGGFCTLNVIDARYVINFYAFAPDEFFSARTIAAALR